MELQSLVLNDNHELISTLYITAKYTGHRPEFLLPQNIFNSFTLLCNYCVVGIGSYRYVPYIFHCYRMLKYFANVLFNKFFFGKMSC